MFTFPFSAGRADLRELESICFSLQWERVQRLLTWLHGRVTHSDRSENLRQHLSPLSFPSRRQLRSHTHAPVQSQGAWLGPTALKSSTSHIRKQQLNMSHVIYMWGEWKEALWLLRQSPRAYAKTKEEKKHAHVGYVHKTNRREVRPERGA